MSGSGLLWSAAGIRSEPCRAREIHILNVIVCRMMNICAAVLDSGVAATWLATDVAHVHLEASEHPGDGLAEGREVAVGAALVVVVSHDSVAAQARCLVVEAVAHDQGRVFEFLPVTLSDLTWHWSVRACADFILHRLDTEKERRRI